jgi:micrococcal nuclease
LTLFCRFLPVLLFFLTVFLSRSAAAAEAGGYFLVEFVIDGDTIVIDGGEKVRYIGLDTPEEGEPFYEKAKERNRRLVGGKRVRLVFCEAQKRDKYGRLLAWVYSNGVFVNETLVREGLARRLVIPPCGLQKYKEFKSAEEEARKNKLGLWASGTLERQRTAKKTITPEEASGHMGQRVTVRGAVSAVKKKRDGVFIVFQGEGGFTAVVFSDLLRELNKAGIDPMEFKGRVLTVTGQIKSYHGHPEMILKRPADIKEE